MAMNRFGRTWSTVLLLFVGPLKVSPLLESTYSYIDDQYGITWMYFPDGDGVPQVANLTRNASPDVGRSDGIHLLKKQIYFELYTRQHQRTPKSIHAHRNNELLEFNSFFDGNVETKIVIHGWQSNTRSDTVQKIKDAYLRTRDCNVIAVNWESIASSGFYFSSAAHTRDVGRYTAELIDYLHRNRGASMQSIHLIGHSLGAHAAGFAGSFTSARVSRISGLDPALPGFEITAGPELRLDPTDAEFVDVIHTCGGVLGFYEPLGHVDFYPNGGVPSQPGCNGFKEVLESCSHGRSHKLFAESIETPTGFYGHACSSWKGMKDGDCSSEPSVLMGDRVPFSASGVMLLFTKDASPYAKGFV